MYNIHYKHDIRYTMQLCRWMLKPIGMWHPIYGHSPSQNEKFISIILIVICFSALCFVLIPAGFYTLFREKDISIKIKLFGPVGFCLTNTIKYCYFGARAAAFGRCIRHVEDDWRIVHHQTREIMLKQVLGRRLTTLCAIFLYTGGLSYYIIMPLSSRQEINENYTIRINTYPGYDMFFDPTASPAYEIMFCIHILFAMISLQITTASCSLAAIFVTHACGQIDILMLLLDDLVEGKRSKNTTKTPGKRSKNVKKRLSAIAKHHVRILRFSASVEEVLREICLLELLTYTLTICLLEYYCLTEWKNSDAIAILIYFILLISFTFNVLIFCYIGELLVEQYSKIGAATYEIDWYNLSGNKALELVLVIAMSHHPPKLTAGKFIDLSMNTFSAILKSSVVYLNLLRTVTE
ncbi:PREDICTED: odorant receptor 4-like [Atta cephalotes]|uniref:Odorant receptor n=1 Tax=Atta cephalotes TaxID=12957 RepID=A0A158P0B6_ATTCE|nr:PREDICTED: odorant receptor 4-like [Atta cephalotes]